jgi:indoleamine 2,3-dioxygenase
MINVSTHLGLPPVPTYSGQTLWNYPAPNLDDAHVENEKVQSHASFTGSPEEAAFFGISVAIEKRGAPLVPTLLYGIEAVKRNDIPKLVSTLQEAEKILDETTSVLPCMYKRCTPAFFYFILRPYLEGTADLGTVGLPHGIFFEDPSGGGTFQKYRGPSNAQSSLFAFVDAALGVKHYSVNGYNKGAGNAQQSGDVNLLVAKERFMKVGHRTRV